LSRALTGFDTLYGKVRASATAPRLLDRAFAVKIFPGCAGGIFPDRDAPGPHPGRDSAGGASAFTDLQAPRGRGTPRA